MSLFLHNLSTASLSALLKLIVALLMYLFPKCVYSVKCAPPFFFFFAKLKPQDPDMNFMTHVRGSKFAPSSSPTNLQA